MMKAKLKRALRNSGVQFALNILFLYIAYSAVIMTAIGTPLDTDVLDSYREMAYFLDGWN